MKALIPLLVFLAGAAFAQPPRAYFPWWEGPLKRDVNLSEEQQQQIRDIQKKYRDQMIDQRAQLEKAEARLKDIFNEKTIEEDTAKAAVDDVVKARGALTRSFTGMSIELRKVLTYEQWRDLQKHRSEWRERRMRGGGRGMRRPGRTPSGRGGAPPADHGPDPGPPPEEL